MTDNELIAEFMGSNPYEDGRYGTMWPDPTNDNKVGFGLKYDKSWDWLMPVVDKIRVMWEDGKLFRCQYYHRIDNMKLYTPIEDVHKAVVEFVKWYNSQK